MLAFLPAVALAAVDESGYCTGFSDTADAEFYQELDISGKQVSVFKTDSSLHLCNYEDFCERAGLEWYAPTSPSEADEALNEVRALDNWHTWIIGKATTVLGVPGVATWNGQILSDIDSPTCSEGSSSGFSAIRDWGCSMCNPEQYGSSNCWDYDHQYDWILCQGEYSGMQEIPEFTPIFAGVALIGAIAGFVILRRKTN